jgi:hypothetical protein
MSDVITVSSVEELYEALAACTGGETILLEGGDYGSLVLNSKSGFDITFPSNVTIASADPENPAVFDKLVVHGAENVTLDGLYFDYTFTAGDAEWYRPFEINNSSNITVVNCTFDGDVAEGVSAAADGYGWAYGLSVRDCSDITIENNEIFGFLTGLIVSQTDTVDVIGNDVHSMRRDGMNFAEVNNVTISDNYIHDFNSNLATGDHPDMIQFWTNGTDSPSTNIVIDNNVLDIGDGTWAQSIFMRNEVVDMGLAGEEMYYQDVTITNNVIVNGHSHGITVGETDGLVISNNTVVHADGGADDGLDSAVEIPTINVNVNATNVTISNNITAGVTGQTGQPDWTVTDNVIVQDQNPNGANYYSNVFITSTLAPENGVHAYVAVPGGVIEAAGAGAPSTLNPEIDGVVEAHFQIAGTSDNAAVRHFDATQTLTTLDALPTGTTYTWDFGDGSTATGPKVSHAFPDGGVYSVVLTVTLPDGSSDSQSYDVGIQGPALLSFKDGQILSYDLGQAIEIGTVGATGIIVPDTGVGLSIKRSHLAEIQGADDIGINLNIQADSANNSGEIIRLHMSFVVAVNDKGELVVTIHDPAGKQYNFTTTGAGLNDLDPHSISINLSGEALTINVDGAVVGGGTVPGGMGNSSTNDLTFGHPWGGNNYDGAVTAFEITANADDFSDLPPVTAPPVTQPPVVEPPVTAPPVTQPPVVEPPVTAPPVTQPPVVEPPVTAPPVTQPPVVEPPVTTPPVTQPPVVEPPVTTPPVTQPPVVEPPVTAPPVTQPPVVEPPVTTPPVTQPPVVEPPVVEPPPPAPIGGGRAALIEKIMLLLSQSFATKNNRATNEKTDDTPSATDKMDFADNNTGDDGFWL